MKNVSYTIASVYDTETCNIGEGKDTIAYPILFIDNDVRDIDFYNYVPDRDDKVNFYRYETEMQARIDEYIDWGRFAKKVPIVCAYNLMFDLQPLMEDLSKRYDIKVTAQSSTNVYVLDLYEMDTENKVLRFWDTYHLEMRGLSAMGETCGLGKALGDWDYSLIRTPETELTDEELFYAKRDVQVIPAYLKYLLHANEWMKQSDLGNKVLTKTSIVRQMARREIAQRKLQKKDGKTLTLDKAFMELCEHELPQSYSIYGLRKACFRGGFTFTAAKTALQITRNVASADVTSMHHTFINGRYVPQNFRIMEPYVLKLMCKHVLERTLEEVLASYHKPFMDAFHARIKFTNVRLRKNSCFEKWGIALESSSKFKRAISSDMDFEFDDTKIASENEVRKWGWHDQYKNAIFAFSKLYEAEEVIMHFNELEFWAFSRVYEWDSFTVLYGEGTLSYKLPPDYVTLQSNKLFEMKSAAKFIVGHYKYGTLYAYNLTGIPEGIANELRAGTLDETFLASWYNGTVKGQFNGIYGTMAQDQLKPDFEVTEGEIRVNKDTVTTPENFDSRVPMHSRVLYTYGMRIVGGSRMHLVIAMELLYRKFGNDVICTGGDTDSLKISCADYITDADLNEALEPIAIASKNAINTCMERLRKQWPDMASSLSGIGAFEIENEGMHYKYHMEAWNKARVSYDEKVHITCAGLSRPSNQMNIEEFMNELISCGYNVEDVFKACLAFDVYVSNDISHSLEGVRPNVTATVDMNVVDYMGKESRVKAHESLALYPVGRWLGESAKVANALTIKYLKEKYGRTFKDGITYLYLNEFNEPLILQGDITDDCKYMEGF